MHLCFFQWIRLAMILSQRSVQKVGKTWFCILFPPMPTTSICWNELPYTEKLVTLQFLFSCIYIIPYRILCEKMLPPYIKVYMQSQLEYKKFLRVTFLQQQKNTKRKKTKTNKQQKQNQREKSPKNKQTKTFFLCICTEGKDFV